jgi:hypothetical protein
VVSVRLLNSHATDQIAGRFFVALLWNESTGDRKVPNGRPYLIDVLRSLNGAKTVVKK